MFFVGVQFINFGFGFLYILFSFYVCGFLFKFFVCSLLLSLFWQFNSLILAKMLSLFELLSGSVGRWDFEFYDSLSYGFSWPKTMKKFPPTPTSCYIYNSSSCIHIPLDERKLSGWPLNIQFHRSWFHPKNEKGEYP